MTKDELRQWTRDNHVAFGKILADGRLVGVTRMFATCRLWVGDTDGWSQAWDYPTMPQALAAAVYFLGEGDPMDGWVRHLRWGWPPCSHVDDTTLRAEAQTAVQAVVQAAQARLAREEETR